MDHDPPTIPSTVHPQAIPALARAPSPDIPAPWPSETRAIVSGAATASALVLAVWSAVLWRHLHPGPVPVPLVFGNPYWFGFSLNWARPLVHALVLAGAVAAAARAGWARQLLLVAASSVLVLGLFMFAWSAVFRSGTGAAPQLLYSSIVSGVRLVTMSIPDALMVLAMTRPLAWQAPAAPPVAMIAESSAEVLGAGPGEVTLPPPLPTRALPYAQAPAPRAGWPFEAKAIVLAAGVDAVAQLVELGAALQARGGGLRLRSLRRSILTFRESDLLYLSAFLAAYAIVLTGVARFLTGRRHPRPWLVIGAIGVLSTRAVMFVTTFSTWTGARTPGGDLYVAVTYELARFGTLGVVYALLLFVMSRPYAKIEQPLPRA